MDVRSQKKIQETKVFRRNAASADCTSDNTVRFYPAGRVCQGSEAAGKDRETASGFTFYPSSLISHHSAFIL
jgi:hypothetical protein